MSFLDPTVALSTRQEAFRRHFTVSGNAADAARRAGNAERFARQTGCALLERPRIVERLRRIRLSWERTERDEARWPGEKEFDPDEPDDTDGPEDEEFTPDHDRT